jgi:hypothetical protein
MKSYESEVGKLWLKKFKKATALEQQDLIGKMHEAYPKSHEYKASLPKPKGGFDPEAPQETELDKERRLEKYELMLQLRKEMRQKTKEKKERTA